MNPDQIEFETIFFTMAPAKNINGDYASAITAEMYKAWNAALNYARGAGARGTGGISLGVKPLWGGSTTTTTHHITDSEFIATAPQPAIPGINDQVEPELMRKRVSEW